MSYNFQETESKILDFWKKNKIFEKSLELTRKGDNFVFFEGPPTANGKPGIHHFLGRAFKDLFGRYKTMRGHFVLRRAGWDTHGLPVEIEVEKELGFKSKKDIENYGIDKFNHKCRESVWKYKKEWEEMTEKMGFWIDMDDAYITYESGYMETLWQIIKQIWDKNLLYKAHKVVPFCVRCGTPLSAHEVAQGYRNIEERSVYLKFKVKSSLLRLGFGGQANLKSWGNNVFVLAWTTTPWTLPGNIALAVGENIVYALAEKDGEKFILAKELVEKVLSGAKIIEEMEGKDLIGIEYEPLFNIPELKSDTSYKVYGADFVSTIEGTGVVHTAVMYGEDDYNLGTKVGLPKIHTVNEQGKFKENVGNDLVGLYVKDKSTEDLIVEKLKSSGKLLKTENYAHDYPFCWRCDSPLLYYAKDSWFIKMSAVVDKTVANNEKINWVPEHIKEGRFGQWVGEGKDWSFSRERYWGTPLPLWECQECDHRTVIGSIQELENLSIGSGNIYFALRHGLSTRNEGIDLIINSRPDFDKYELTEEGKEQIKEAAGILKKMGGIDMIFSSPFKRTKASAEIIAKELDIELKLDDRIKEITHDLGCEGKSSKLCPEKGRALGFKEKHGDGESWDDVRTRVADFMNELETKYQGKKILIVSHGDPIWLLNGICHGSDEKEILASDSEWYPKIGEPIKLEWRNISRNNLGALDLHRPYIDTIKLKCEKCGSEMKKIPELIDVWFDSGAMPFGQWHWPFENEDMISPPSLKLRRTSLGAPQFPADFITEGVDQTRGWFYTLLAISTLLEKGAPYKNVLCFSHVLDEGGKKMSKSKGNVVSPFEVIEKYGADSARWYFYTVNMPGEYKLFSFKELQTKSQGFISTLQNCLRFYDLYNDRGTKSSTSETTTILDKWVISKLNKLIMNVTTRLDEYDPTNSARLIEKFVNEDFSNWWLRRSRKREDAHKLLRELLITILKLLAPFMPFMAEEAFLKIGGTKNESVHLESWPTFDKKLIDEELETAMAEVREVITAGLAVRKEKQIKVRQPLRTIFINRDKEFDSELEELIKDELNVKEVEYKKGDSIEFDTEISPNLKAEGYARELIRQIQDMRKEAKYKLSEEVFCRWSSDNAELREAISEWSDAIKKETLLSDFKNEAGGNGTFDVQKEFEIASGKKILIGVKK